MSVSFGCIYIHSQFDIWKCHGKVNTLKIVGTSLSSVVSLWFSFFTSSDCYVAAGTVMKLSLFLTEYINQTLTKLRQKATHTVTVALVKHFYIVGQWKPGKFSLKLNLRSLILIVVAFTVLNTSIALWYLGSWTAAPVGISCIPEANTIPMKILTSFISVLFKPHKLLPELLYTRQHLSRCPARNEANKSVILESIFWVYF